MLATKEPIRRGRSIASPGVEIVQMRQARKLSSADATREMMPLRKVSVATFDARRGPLPHATDELRQLFEGEDFR